MDNTQQGNLFGFNAETVPDTTPTYHIPAGDYLVAIIASEVKETKAKDGSYLYLRLEVLEGQHKGHKLEERLNLWNKSPKAKAIAESTLAKVCKAVGVLTPEDSTQLHNLPLVATVKVRKSARDGQEYYNNDIKGYQSRAEAQGQKQQQASAPASGAAPWAS